MRKYLNKILDSFGYQIVKKKEKITKELIEITNSFVMSGNYKNIKLNFNKLTKQKNLIDKSWTSRDISSKLLGFYEEQVQKECISLKESYSLKNLVHFGASDGYHSIGLTKNFLFQKSLVFEIDSFSRRMLERNIIENKLANKILLFKEANFVDVNNNIVSPEFKNTLYLVDIEGHEFDLFTEENLIFFKNSYLLIENHEFLIVDTVKKKNFFNLLNAHFNISYLANSSRNPYLVREIDHFHDEDRWALVSEGRPCNMNWLICKPKNN